MQALFERDLKHGLKEGEQLLLAWLDTQRPLPSVVTTEPWKYAAFSRAGFHWTLCRHPPEQTLRLLEVVGVDYVVIRRRERKCNFVRDLLSHELTRVLAFRNGVYVYRLSDRIPERSRRTRLPGRELHR